jgi:hypothetical protein
VSGPGYHIALTREHAKRLFGLKEEPALREFFQELRTSNQLKKEGRVLESATVWDPLHRCLTEGELDPEGGDFPLNHAVLGGKRLVFADDLVAVLVRPDMTNFVAEGLAEVEEEDVRKKYFALDPAKYGKAPTEKEFQQVWLKLNELRTFFDEAAANLDAVVFVGVRQ